jgi:hypothetical protein
MMSYSNQYSHGKRNRNNSRYIWFAVFFFLLIATVFGYRKMQRTPEWSRPVAQYYGKAATWIAERKEHLTQKAAKVRKNIEVSDDPDRAVNFEFYNTLEDMQSMQARVEVETEARNQPKKLADAEQNNDKTAAPPLASVKPKTKQVVKVSQAADLEKDLLATMKQRGGR